ncbi:MAG TPA: TolC family protein [Flavisolibacter sp.]|nr:TolC family protein [Flavisolibacter sp.]
MKLLLILFLLLWLHQLNAQQKVFTEKEFIAVVKKFHPVARLAANNVDISRRDIGAARAAFDPEWKTQQFQKYFDGLRYYDQSFHELKIPTWYGIDLYAGQETINGDRVNPEETKGGLTYFGFSVPLIQNMVMDKRRAALLLAKNYFELSEVQRQIEINNLMKESLEAYWRWWEQYHVFDLMNKTLRNAEKRLAFIRSAYQLGERPAIDTLEAFTQVQSFQIKISETLAAYTNAQLALSAYLWTENLGQVHLSPDVIPEKLSLPDVIMSEPFLNAVGNHPEIRQYDFKLKGLNIEKKLTFQLLLPEVRLKYNQLGRDLSKTINAGWFANNYNYGITVSMPLRLSEGRAEYAKTKIKIENTRIEQSNKQVELQVKVKQY